jgi:hypothetical protein
MSESDFPIDWKVGIKGWNAVPGPFGDSYVVKVAGKVYEIAPVTGKVGQKGDGYYLRAHDPEKADFGHYIDASGKETTKQTIFLLKRDAIQAAVTNYHRRNIASQRSVFARGAPPPGAVTARPKSRYVGSPYAGSPGPSHKAPSEELVSAFLRLGETTPEKTYTPVEFSRPTQQPSYPLAAEYERKRLEALARMRAEVEAEQRRKEEAEEKKREARILREQEEILKRQAYVNRQIEKRQEEERRSREARERGFAAALRKMSRKP